MSNKLNLFRLHVSEEDNTPKKWIRVSGKYLPKKLEEYVLSILRKRKITRNQLIKEIIKKNGCGKNVTYSTLYTLKDNKDIRIPLILIENILEIGNTLKDKLKIQEYFEYLQTSISHKGTKIKAVKELTDNLCKIAGAHAADGSLIKETNKEGYFTYRFEIGDQDLSALNIFNNWLSSTFGLNLTIKKKEDKDMHHVQLKNKILFRYLHIILGFPFGEKTFTVGMPQIIKENSLKMRNSFVTGAFTFEAGVSEEGAVAFRVASKRFAEDVVYTLRENGINAKICVEKRGFWSFKVGLLSKPQPKIKNFFEYGTLKYYKVNGFLYSFNSKITNFTEAIEYLDSFFRRSTTKYLLSDILKLISKLKIADFETILKNIKNNISRRALRSKLMVLEHFRCIKVTRKGEVSQAINLSNINQNIHLLLNKRFLYNLFNELLENNNIIGLAKKLQINKNSLGNWKIGTRGIPYYMIQKFISLSDYTLEDVKENIESVSNKNIYIYNGDILSWKIPSWNNFKLKIKSITN